MTDVIVESMWGRPCLPITAQSIYHPFYHNFFDRYNLERTDLNQNFQKTIENQKLKKQI